MKQDLYIEVGVTTLRSPDDTTLIDVPLYIKVSGIGNNGLAECEEKLLTKISDALLKQHEKKVMEKLTGLKKQKKAKAAVTSGFSASYGLMALE